MQNLPVHWSEGLFLQPHHLQANDRYWTEITQTSQQWDHPYHYGLRDADISAEAIANQQFELRSCHARMKDGTLVSLDGGQGLDRVELKEAFAKAAEVQVSLAVPKLKLGRVNVGGARGPASDGPPPRYLENRRGVQDESLGGNDQEIAFRDLNVRLLLSTQDTAGYETLPIAQVRRAGEKTGRAAARRQLHPAAGGDRRLARAWPATSCARSTTCWAARSKSSASRWPTAACRSPTWSRATWSGC